MSYKLIPLSQHSNNPVLAALLEQFVAGNFEQKAVQAAAWNLANNMSWQELSNKKIKHLGGVPAEPYFQPAQLMRAQGLVAIAQRVASNTGHLNLDSEQQTSTSPGGKP